MQSPCIDICRKNSRTQPSRALATQVDHDRAGEVLPDDPARASCDRKRFDEAGEVIAEQNHVSAFAGHVGSRSHGDTHACLRQGRSVVDASLTLDFVGALQAFLLASAGIWSLWLGWQIAGLYEEACAHRIFAMFPFSLAVAMSCASWATLFWPL